jgi:hypothetical protein
MPTKKLSSRQLLRELRVALAAAKQLPPLTTIPRILTLIEGIIWYLELRRKRQ